MILIDAVEAVINKCVRGWLPLSTSLPRRLILGNSYSYARIPIWYRGIGKRACSPGYLEEFFSETGRPPNLVLGNPVPYIRYSRKKSVADSQVFSVGSGYHTHELREG